MHTLRLSMLSLMILTLGLTSVATSAASGSSVRAVGIRGWVPNVDGETAVVEVLLNVAPGEDHGAKARATLKRMVPEARPFAAWEYSLTGLVWDQFLDVDPQNDSVVHNYNPQGQPSDMSRSVWVEAWQTWNGVPGSKFRFADGGSTRRCPSLVRECPGRQVFDGNNDVGWMKIPEPGVLGVTWYGTATDEFDMVLDNDWHWYEGADPTLIGAGEIDAQTVWLHEQGHGVGLGHSTVTGAVMEGTYAGPRRTLHQDDIDGVVALYPASSCSDDAECDDGLSCNGAESCNEASGLCQAGASPCPSDGIACTHDCVEATSECNVPNHSLCDDGDPCTLDTCDSTTGCLNEPILGCSCGENKAPCAIDDDCCSLKCRGGMCRGD